MGGNAGEHVQHSSLMRRKGRNACRECRERGEGVGEPAAAAMANEYKYDGKRIIYIYIYIYMRVCMDLISIIAACLSVRFTRLSACRGERIYACVSI